MIINNRHGEVIDLNVSDFKLLAMRQVLESYWEFRRKICGYKDFDELHRTLVDPFLTAPHRNKLLIIPRNHLKSSAIMAYISWRLIQNPNLSILYESSVYQQAQRYVREISNIMTSPEFKLIFGNWEGEKWTDSELIVSRRKIFQPAPSVSASGIDRTQTGQHYDLIVADDIVDEHNSKTQDGREKVIDRYKQYTSLLRPGGELIITGTPWDEEDLYGWLHTKNELIGQFRVLRLGVYDDSGKIRFKNKFVEKISELDIPGNHGKESLEKLRIANGTYRFSCNYLCIPHRGEEAEFKPNWLIRAPHNECLERLKTRRGRIYIFCDPAMGKENTKDPCDVGIILAHFMPDQMIDVLEDHTKRMTPGDTVEWLHALATKYCKDIDVEVCIEDVNFSGMLIPLVEELRRKSNVYYVVTPVPARGDKEKRIRGLFPYYQFKQIRHSDKIKDGKLEKQLTRFPLDHLKDAADAFSQFTQVLNWPMKQMLTEPDWIKEIPVNRYTTRAYPNKKKENTAQETSYVTDKGDSLFDYR